MAADPAPLTDNDRYRLSWEVETERFYDAAYTGSRKRQPSITDIALARLHRHVAGWDILTGVCDAREFCEKMWTNAGREAPCLRIHIPLTPKPSV